MLASGLPELLLAASLLIWIGSIGLILQRRAAARADTARARAILNPHRRGEVIVTAPASAISGRFKRLSTPLARLLGFKLRRVDDGPIPRWAVLVMALIAARALTFVAALLIPSIPQAAPVPVIWIFFCNLIFKTFENRRREKLFREFPDALDIMVRGLRVGQNITQALRGVARDAPELTAREFSHLADRFAIGVPMAEALNELADEAGLTEYRFFATTLLLQTQTGGSPTDALDGLADVIRNRMAIRRRGRALASEAVTSATVLGLMPIAVGSLLYIASPDYVGMLVTDPTGRLMLGVGIAMLTTGVLVMRTMIGQFLR